MTDMEKYIESGLKKLEGNEITLKTFLNKYLEINNTRLANYLDINYDGLLKSYNKGMDSCSRLIKISKYIQLKRNIKIDWWRLHQKRES